MPKVWNSAQRGCYRSKIKTIATFPIGTFLSVFEGSISRASEGTVFRFFSSVEFTSYRNAL